MKPLLRLILCCLVSGVLNAQQSIEAPIVVIVDNQNPITLIPSDLKAEIGHRAATVVSVTPLGGVGLQYVLLNDTSGRTQWPKGTKQQAAIADELLRQVVAPSSDVGSLVNFDDHAYIDVPNEKDPEKLSAKLGRTGRGSTAMYDTVIKSAKWLPTQAATAGSRRVMFLLCDGEDNASQHSLDQATEALQEARIPIFIIAPSSVESGKQGEALRRLANGSGGRVYFLPRDTRQVKFDLLKRDLAQSFLLKVTVSSSEGSELMPVTIIDASDPRISIIGPSQIAVTMRPAGMETFDSAHNYFEHGRHIGFPAFGNGAPYVLRAEFEAKAHDGTIAKGQYEDTWLSDTQWRREVMFEKSRYVRSRNGDKTYQFAEGENVGLLRFVMKIMEPIPAIDTFTESDWRIKRDTVNGVRSVRVLAGYESPEGKLDPEQARGYWFDDTGLLVKTYFAGVETQRSEFEDFAGVRIAQRVDALQDGKLAMRIRVREVSPAGTIPAKTFEVKGHEWTRAFTAEVR